MITFIISKKTPAYDTLLSKIVGKGTVERRTMTQETMRSVFDELQTLSLFGDKQVFVISGLDDDDVRKDFFATAGDYESAPNDMVVVMESLLAADMKKAEKIGMVHKLDDKKAKAGQAFNPFALANAFAAGDKKEAWIMYNRVMNQADEAEPTHGMIWWKLKDMVVKKQIALADAQKKARELVAVYHESRLGGLGMRERLEKFLLQLPSGK